MRKEPHAYRTDVVYLFDLVLEVSENGCPLAWRGSDDGLKWSDILLRVVSVNPL
jgi:hypothetical protein